MKSHLITREYAARFYVFCAVLMSVTLFGCASHGPTSVESALPFAQAATIAADGLASQTQKLPGFLNKLETKLAKRSVVLDPLVDSGSGQQTGATKQLEQIVGDRLATNQFELLAFNAGNLAKVQYLLIGTTTRITSKAANTIRIDLALIDLKTGNVVAQSASVARIDGVDMTPTPYYRDSPVLVKDKVINAYVRTASTLPGQHADPIYLDRIAAAATISSATDLYDQGHYEDSLKQYKSVAATPAGDQLRVTNGIYLNNWKLNRVVEAEAAFAKVVATGISNNQLGVKFLFNPGSTEFWSDAKISGTYPMWLRQIARETSTANVCMTIVGHTSHTGTEQVNDSLSLQRASYIKQRLGTEAPSLNSKLKAEGKGFRENIIGSGTDDARDALDRRVEFKIVPCG